MVWFISISCDNSQNSFFSFFGFWGGRADIWLAHYKNIMDKVTCRLSHRTKPQEQTRLCVITYKEIMGNNLRPQASYQT
jgi:hypothetical protein